MTALTVNQGFEQISLNLMVTNSCEAFFNGMRSTRAKVLMLGAFSDKEAAVRQFLHAKGKSRLLDRRRSLTEEEENYLALVQGYADDAKEYIGWARHQEGLPIWQEALVANCFAFENCVKGIAVAFHLAENQREKGLDGIVLVPSEELVKARRQIDKLWKKESENRVQTFVSASIFDKKPKAAPYRLPSDVSIAEWTNCAAAFKLRNAIVHNLGVVDSKLSLGSEEFMRGWQANVTEKTVAAARLSFQRVLNPFEPDSLGFY